MSKDISFLEMFSYVHCADFYCPYNEKKGESQNKNEKEKKTKKRMENGTALLLTIRQHLG